MMRVRTCLRIAWQAWLPSMSHQVTSHAAIVGCMRARTVNHWSWRGLLILSPCLEWPRKMQFSCGPRSWTIPKPMGGDPLWSANSSTANAALLLQTGNSRKPWGGLSRNHLPLGLAATSWPHVLARWVWVTSRIVRYGSIL